ncbi:hypothetical protein ABID22_003969, partial [Pontibacter aydingkolensis]
TNAGTATASFSYAETANHLASSDSKTFTIGKANATITAPSMSKYCGQINPLTGYSCSVTGAVNREVIATSYTIEGTTVIPASSDPQLSNYNTTYKNGVLTINGLTLDASDANTPRSIHDDVLIKVTVKDGTNDIAGVAVDLLFDGTVKATATSDPSGVATFNLGKLAVNVYAVTASAGGGNCSVSSVVYLPIYDPEGGFITGGGWINSPAGALSSNPSITGKANFGFVSKYKKGSSQVDGNTEFQFSAGGINFKSSFHESGSLVIAGAKAMYRGEGTVNGASGYKFSITAIDGHWNGGSGPDKFRIKITKNGSTIYDNGLGADENSDASTALGGGSIVIHEVKSVGKTSTSSKLITEAKPALEEQGTFYNYPNAFSDRTTIAFSLNKEESYSLDVYDVKGALVMKVSMGVAEADKLYEFEVDGRSMAEGIYIARLVTSSRSQSIKMILKK